MYPEEVFEWQQLPAIARNYLEIQKPKNCLISLQNIRRKLQLFYRHLDLAQKQTKDIDEEIIKSFKRRIWKIRCCQATRVSHLYQLRRYLDWLKGQKIVNLKLELDSILPMSQKSRSMTIGKDGIRYLDQVKCIRKNETWKHNRRTLADFYYFLSGHNKKLSELTRTEIEYWLKSLHERGLSPATKDRYIQIVKQFSFWAYEHRYINIPADKLFFKSDIPKIPKYLPRPIPVEIDIAIKKILLKNEDTYSRAILLMRNTGLRRGELISLPLECLLNSGADYLLKVPLGKLDNERAVPLDEATYKLVRSIQKQTQVNRINNGMSLINAPLLTDALGQALKAANINIILKKISKDLNYPNKITSHQLRHTYATTMLNAGISLIVLMKLLGHKSPKMTLRYADISQSFVKEEYYLAQEKICQDYKLSSVQENNDPIDVSN
jgi:site-specific recombinase XerD